MKQLVTTLSLVLISFLSFAQITCDQVTIESVTLEPINMEVLQVHLTIDSQEFGFSYPGIRIYDENDNLVGEEEVNFFGIIEESTHLVPHNLEDIVPGDTYNFKVELWSDFYDVHECTFENSFIVRPVDACSPISLTASLQNFNGTVETHDLQVIDQDGQIVFEDEVTFSDTLGYLVQELCLDPGCYTYLFAPQDGESSNEISCWINSFAWFFPEGYIQSTLDGPIAIDFGVYSDCLVDVIEPEKSLELLIYPNPARERINVVGIPSGSTWSLQNSQGQEVKFGADSGRVEIDVEDLASGMYFLKINTGTSVHSFQIVR